MNKNKGYYIVAPVTMVVAICLVVFCTIINTGGKAENATQYARKLFPALGDSRIYNEAIWARNELSNLVLPLYFCGDRYYVGNV